jgi:alkanesulfonate monooxygenase SsuD/methylene tetrahydromethanopterin reductase-like flavin-dependent oxidoreductase (luciferase family)
MLDLAQHAEELGYWGVFLNDHVQGLSGDGMQPYLEAWTAMAGIGVQTKRIRLGHIVLFNSMRNPAFLAKSISTIDRMTGGRYEVILGAGWNAPEYEGYDFMERGRGMPRAGERVERMKEALLILRGMFDNEVFSFEGKYWTLKDAVNMPQPVQKPLRISVGGSKPRMMRIAVKYADGLNSGGGINSVKNTIARLTPVLEKNQKRIEDFFYSGFATQVTVTKNVDEYDALAKRVAESTGRKMNEVKEDIFAGPPDVLIEKLRSVTDMGVKMMVIFVRPASTLKEMKEQATRFRDLVMTQL